MIRKRVPLQVHSHQLFDEYVGVNEFIAPASEDDSSRVLFSKPFESLDE